MPHAYSQLIDLKRWADRGLYAAVGRNLDRLTAEETSVMLRIFGHMHVVDSIFRHRLRGAPHSLQAPRSEEIPQFQALADNERESSTTGTRRACAL